LASVFGSTGARPGAGGPPVTSPWRPTSYIPFSSL
jgi:hypothetical protein